MCQSLKAVLTRQDRRQKIKFVNIADHEYDPSTNMGAWRGRVAAGALRAGG